MYPEGQRDLPVERPIGGLKGPLSPEFRKTSRAVIVEPHPAVRAVLEYLLAREGYVVETHGEPLLAPPSAPPGGPALLLVAAEDGDGIYVFESRDDSEILRELRLGAKSSLETLAGVTGMQVFLPKPFGARDVMRVVRMVSGFDGRRGNRSETA